MVSARPDIICIALPTPFPVGPVNAYLVKGDVPVLVDVGPKTDAAYQALRFALQEHGLSIKDIAIILMTHGHIDHGGLLSRLLNESQAQAYAHPATVEQYRAYDRGIEDNHSFVHECMLLFGTPPDIVEQALATRSIYADYIDQAHIANEIQDAQEIAGLTAYWVPGHSASDIVFHDPRRAVAFTGDHLLNRITPNPIMRREFRGTRRAKSLLEFENSLQRTRSLDIETCYPGHGVPFGDHRAVVDNLMRRHERRTEQVRSLLEKGPATPYQLTLALFPKKKLDVQWLHLAVSAAIGHLDILEKRGVATSYTKNGTVYYTLIERGEN